MIRTVEDFLKLIRNSKTDCVRVTISLDIYTYEIREIKPGIRSYAKCWGVNRVTEETGWCFHSSSKMMGDQIDVCYVRNFNMIPEYSENDEIMNPAYRLLDNSQHRRMASSARLKNGKHQCQNRQNYQKMP